MNYRNVYRALSVKNAYLILREIYEGCLTDDFRSFDYLKDSFKMNKSTLRRITNRLSACGLIESKKTPTAEDKRKRVYVISDKELVERISELTEYIAR